MLKLYNTLSRKLEEFKPLSENKVGIYSCGPTVYWNQHIGHMYAYTQWDCLVRTFRYLGFDVKWVMNITDVGHLTSDEDAGEDKMEKGAKREGATVWEIADKYIAQFKESLKLLNISSPDVMCRATEHIQQQIELIKKIEANGFTYKTKTGLVFDTSKFQGYADFARLNLDEQNSGSRVEVDEEKKNPWDFLLWITNQPNHIMKWDSPWGEGFPGWHIECTAMSTKYLGDKFDIHTGGKEHIPVHHTNEIAQGFGAFGRQTANFWLHNEWLTFNGEKISKSLGNSILVSDLLEKGFSPLALRYLILTSHYRSGLNFSWESLKGAQTALERLYEFIYQSKCKVLCPVINQNEKEAWRQKFIDAISDDLGFARAISIVWELIKDKQISDYNKFELLLEFDKVLGLNLEVGNKQNSNIEIPKEIIELAEKRKKFRDEQKWSESDEVRKEIEERGYKVLDNKEGFEIKKI